MADTGDTTAAPAAVIVAFLIKSLLSISLVISYSQMTLEARAESSSLGLCLARRNCNKIEFFLNLSANIRKSGKYLLYLPQVYD
jgi:hypothetical protein